MTTNSQIDSYIEVSEGRAAQDRAEIIWVLKQNPEGLNTWEISLKLNEPYYVVQPRVAELLEADRIRKTGIRRMGRVKDGEVYIYNAFPIKKPKKLKPVGDKILWRKMIIARESYIKSPNAHHLVAMNKSAINWIGSLEL